MGVSAGRKEGRTGRSALNLSYVSFTLFSLPGRHTHQHTSLCDSCSLSCKPTSTPRIVVRERIISERCQESEGPRRDSGPLRCNHHPLCGFLACVRKCLRGILRYCHRIFSRNPLRPCLGLWTHTRYFHPLFRFKAVEPNTSLSVPQLSTKFPGRRIV